MKVMPQVLRYRLLSLRDLLVSIGPVALLPLFLLAGAYWWLQPTPPRHVTLATGPAQSAYEAFGRRYAEALAREGITVQLRPTEGSAANLELLRQGAVDLAFVQGGSASASQGEGEGEADDEVALQSLGSLFMEPVWLFYRSQAARDRLQRSTLTSLTQLQGLRVNVGAPGSGVPTLLNQLLDANRIERRHLQLSHLATTPATVAFLAGEIDVLAFASAPESPMVQMLLQTPGVQLLDFVQSEAYARRFPYLTPVTLPRGVVDLARDLPGRDIRLVAATTSLLTSPQTHPALQQLFAQAAQELHGQAGWFNRAREFPNLRHNEVPLSREAERTYTEGPSWLQRYLPFWLANLVQRMGLAMGLVLAIALPLSRVVPPLYTFRVRSRVFRWYGRLRDIEQRLDQQATPPPQLLAELDEVESQLSRLPLPLSYTDELYALRSHLRWVRAQVTAAAQLSEGGARAQAAEPA